MIKFRYYKTLAKFNADSNVGNDDIVFVENDLSLRTHNIAYRFLPATNSVSSQNQSTKFLREDGTWAAPSYTSQDGNTTYKFTIGTVTKGDSTNGVDLGTLKSETAAANGTALSLVTTGEKNTWNNKLSLSGGTVTGDINMQRSEIDASKSNNNVSSISYPSTFCVLDVAGRILSRKELIVNPNGDLACYWYVRNYNTGGTIVAQKGIKLTVNKSGNLTYSIDDAANFRSAIGAGTSSFSGNYNDLTNKPTIPAAQVQSDWNATSGMGVILNKPTIPTNTNQLTNGAGFISSIPTDYKKSYASVVTVSANTANVTCPSTLGDGDECTVIYANSGSTDDYSVTVTTDYVTPDGAQLDLTCPKSGYCEVNYLKIGSTIYARGV